MNDIGPSASARGNVLFDCMRCGAKQAVAYTNGKLRCVFCSVREQDPLYLSPTPEGIRVNCGDLDRVKEMTPKAMRGFALRLLEMAEGRE